jgi:beta-lactamase regulating signal transducer with metallopeptidase domain
LRILLEYFDPLARLLAQALLNSLWQGLLIIALTMLSVRLLRTLSATTRHAIWLVSLLTIAVLPFLTAATPRRVIQSEERIIQPSPPPAIELQSAAPAGKSLRVTDQDCPESFSVANVTSELPNEIRLTAVTRSLPTSIQRNENSWLNLMNAKIPASRLPLVMVSAWLLIATLLICRIGKSYLALIALRRTLRPLTEADQQHLQRVADLFGIRRQVRLGVAESVTMPLTTGWLKPLIILPTGLTTQLSAAECESILAHELAHIRRHDYLINLGQRLIQACLFFHPAVWLIGRQIAIERELACDDWAVKVTGEPRLYAGCLARLAELLPGRRPLAAATGIIFGRKIVSRRIEMILNHQRNATTFVSKLPLTCASILMLLALFVCAYFNPVVAVPLQQERRAAAPRRETRTPAPPATVTAPKATTAKTIPSPEAEPQPPVVMTAPIAATAPVAIIVDPDDELTPSPAAPLAWPAPAVTVTAAAPIAPVAWAVEQQPMPAPAPPVGGVTIWPGQDTWTVPAVIDAETFLTGARQSAIPENELLPVLTDIARKDTDPAVRSEALRGIYRLRSDASIDSLIQVYDAMSDAKVKSEIIGYLIRRKGDNTKAINKLIAIVKTEKDDDVRRQALRQLLFVKGDDGASHLIEIYDSLQDAKVKQTVLRYLAANRSKKAIDKLMQIARSDPDPTIRQMAIRALAGSDGNFPFELLGAPARSNILRSYEDELFKQSRGEGSGSGSGIGKTVRPAQSRTINER